MKQQSLFVDLPNLYSNLLESGIQDPRLVRDYFLEWFDFDRLALKLTGDFSPVWVFYSGRRFGPKPNRIEGEYLEHFTERINSLKGVTAYDVDIPGLQREPARYQCDKCGHQGMAQWESEKGIDASLTVRLFDTMDSWDIAYLLSGDADFVPAVASLRRRGKIVTGAGFPSASSALVRECYEYMNLLQQFFAEDISSYMLCKQEGLVWKWLTEVAPVPDETASDTLTVHLSWSFDPAWKDSHYQLNVSSRGNYDTSAWLDTVSRLPSQSILVSTQRVPDQRQRIAFRIHLSHWRRCEQELKRLGSSTRGLVQEKNSVLPDRGLDSYILTYRFNRETNRYEVSE